MNARIPEIVAPFAGIAIGVGVGAAVGSWIEEDTDYVAKRQTALETCQYTLEDVPTQMPELPEACEDFAPYVAYNYAEGNYYVPAASELPDLIPAAEELYAVEIEKEDATYISTMIGGVIGGMVGLAVCMDLNTKRLEKERKVTP